MLKRSLTIHGRPANIERKTRCSATAQRGTQPVVRAEDTRWSISVEIESHWIFFTAPAEIHLPPRLPAGSCCRLPLGQPWSRGQCSGSTLAVGSSITPPPSSSLQCAGIRHPTSLLTRDVLWEMEVRARGRHGRSLRGRWPIAPIGSVMRIWVGEGGTRRVGRCTSTLFNVGVCQKKILRFIPGIILALIISKRNMLCNFFSNYSHQLFCAALQRVDLHI